MSYFPLIVFILLGLLGLTMLRTSSRPASRMRYLPLVVCLLANLLALLLAFDAQFNKYGDSQTRLVVLYLPFAGLLSPLLFIAAIVSAPRGTFRFGERANDERVKIYRWLFWGNLALVAIVFLTISKLSWRMGT